MARSIQAFEINGRTILVEVDDAVGPVRSAATSEFEDTNALVDGVKSIAGSLCKLEFSETLAAIIEPIHAGLATFKPEEVSVELTLGIKAGAGVFLASGEANAQVKVTAKWKPK